MKNQILVKVASLFIITSYFLGFVIKEDSSGGGQVDYAAIVNNFKLFQESDLLKIDWSRYISSSLPIYYIISKYIIPTNYSFFFYSGYFSLFISISAILITYKFLCIKNKIQSLMGAEYYISQEIKKIFEESYNKNVYNETDSAFVESLYGYLQNQNGGTRLRKRKHSRKTIKKQIYNKSK
jgi:hypothetical protein